MSNLCPHIQTIYDNESKTQRCATCGVHTADGALDHTLNAQGEHAEPAPQLHDDVREYAKLAALETYLRMALQKVEADLAKVKSRLAQAANKDGARYLRAGDPAIVRISNVPGQGVKIGLITVEDI